MRFHCVLASMGAFLEQCLTGKNDNEYQWKRTVVFGSCMIVDGMPQLREMGNSNDVLMSRKFFFFCFHHISFCQIFFFFWHCLKSLEFCSLEEAMVQKWNSHRNTVNNIHQTILHSYLSIQPHPNTSHCQVQTLFALIGAFVRNLLFSTLEKMQMYRCHGWRLLILIHWVFLSNSCPVTRHFLSDGAI